MKVKNISGLAYHFFPSLLQNKLTETAVANGISKTLSGNKVAFFIGDMPDAATLYSKVNFDNLVTEYQNKLVFKLENFDMEYSYDKKKKERIVQKMPVDAVTYTSAVGTEGGNDKIGWCCIKLEPINAGIEDCLVFSNNIGTWDSPNIIAMFEKLEVYTGGPVLFKDLTISIRDVHETDLV
jgi:hypothetical protein